MNENILITGKDRIAMFRMISMKYALALEIKGIKNSRWSIYALVKKEFGFKGNRKSVYAQFVAHIEKLKEG
jgi:hypothetical protein